MEYPMPYEDGTSDNSLNFFSFSYIWGWSTTALLPWDAAAVEQLNDRPLRTPEDYYFHSSLPPSWAVQEPASFQSDTNVQWEHSSRRSLPSASPDPSELTSLDVSPVFSRLIDQVGPQIEELVRAELGRMLIARHAARQQHAQADTEKWERKGNIHVDSDNQRVPTAAEMDYTAEGAHGIDASQGAKPNNRRADRGGSSSMRESKL